MSYVFTNYRMLYVMTYLAKICRTTHIAINIRAKPPIIPKRVGSTYDPTDISRDFESASKNEINF